MRLTRFIPAAFAVMALLPGVASAQSVQYTGHVGSMQLGNPFGPGAHPFVGPYTMKFTATQSQFDIYCIDFDHSFTGNAFNARILTFADAVNSSLSFNGVDNFTALKRALGTTDGYIGSIPNFEADYLNRLAISSVITTAFAGGQAAHWDEAHYAIWSLFSGNVTPYMNDGVNNHLTYAIGGAAAVAGGANYSQWRIIVDERAWDNSFTGNLEQTSIAVSTVPEPGTYALVGVGMLALAGAARRRNRSRQQAAGSTQLA